MPRRKPGEVLDLSAKFGSVNFNAKTATVRVTVQRNDLKLSAADKSLCERRLTGTINAKPPDVAADQGVFDGMDGDCETSGTFDVKKLNVASETIGFGLTFNLKGVDRNVLSMFANRAGRLMIDDVGDIPEEEKKKLPDEEEENGEEEEAE